MAKVYKGTGTKIAKLAGNHAVMDEAAGRVAAGATANAARHRRTGQYSNNFKVARVRSKVGVTDRVVYNDHPAACAVEFGHVVAHKDGTRSFVPGQFNLLGAIR